ncbi:hypothetical protein BB561_000395 [Smittium simulii]|uniref:Uncharacterized protein n=1 Tax=Smittium simulii TaxID=133385 RepID=A0A2T9YZE4_9FUNG|nr:hypothetical protein BB561_000395 [Smittium simulii]
MSVPSFGSWILDAFGNFFQKAKASASKGSIAVQNSFSPIPSNDFTIGKRSNPLPEAQKLMKKPKISRERRSATKPISKFLVHNNSIEEEYNIINENASNSGSLTQSTPTRIPKIKEYEDYKKNNPEETEFIEASKYPEKGSITFAESEGFSGALSDRKPPEFDYLISEKIKPTFSDTSFLNTKNHEFEIEAIPKYSEYQKISFSNSTNNNELPSNETKEKTVAKKRNKTKSAKLDKELKHFLSKTKKSSAVWQNGVSSSIKFYNPERKKIEGLEKDIQSLKKVASLCNNTRSLSRENSHTLTNDSFNSTMFSETLENESYLLVPPPPPPPLPQKISLVYEQNTTPTQSSLQSLNNSYYNTASFNEQHSAQSHDSRLISENKKRTRSFQVLPEALKKAKKHLRKYNNIDRLNNNNSNLLVNITESPQKKSSVQKNPLIPQLLQEMKSHKLKKTNLLNLKS